MEKVYKKVVILGLKDEYGKYYACNGHLECASSARLTLLSLKEFVPARTVEIYPYTTFTSFSTYDPNQFIKTFIEVELEMSDKEFADLDTCWIYYYQLHDRQVKMIREIEKPWAYAMDIYKNSDAKRQRGIRYEMCTWQSQLSFVDDTEFNLFMEIWDKESFSVTPANLSRLPEILKHPISKLEMFYYRHGAYEIRGSISELNEIIKGLDKPSLVNYAYASSYDVLEDIDKEIKDKEFFEMLVNRDKRGGETDYKFFLSYMPEDTVKEYSADDLFEKCYPQIHYLKKENEAEYQLNLESSSCDYEFDYDDFEDCDDPEIYNPCDMDCASCCIGRGRDERDDEVEALYRLFPDLTPKSIPLLKTLNPDKFRHLLNCELQQQLA